MQKLIITAILTSVVFQTFSQIDSLQKQILSYDDSKSVIISKGRNMLLDKFMENDFEKVREIKNYLIEKAEDDNYIALYPYEYWLILYWTNEYQELSNSIKALDSTAITSYSTRIRPFEDALIAQLLLKSRDHSQKIKNQIQYSSIDIEMKNFLLLNFESMTMNDWSFQDTLNVHADIFLDLYPETEYFDFINKHIKLKFVPKNWRATCEFFIASGYSILTGELKNDYTNNIMPFVGSFDVCYKNIELYLRFAFVNNKTKKNFDYSSGVYEKGSSSQLFFPEASLGYAALHRGRFKLAPFVGIGAVSVDIPLKETEKNPDLKELSKSAFAYNVGANIEIKLGKMGYQFRPAPNGGFIRIRYTYSMPQFSNKYDGMSGSVHLISIGYGVFLTALKRV